jgi:hypothetical protein
MLDAYLPKMAILIWSVVFNCARFENQRWVRVRLSGLRGSNARIGVFVDATVFVGWTSAITIVALSLYDFGWRMTVGLLVWTTVAGFIWSALGGYAERIISRYAVWIIGTMLVYVAAIALFFQFSWFGYL